MPPFTFPTYYTKDDISDLWTDIVEQFEGRPFGDLGSNRQVFWSELGITWEIHFPNVMVHSNCIHYICIQT